MLQLKWRILNLQWDIPRWFVCGIFGHKSSQVKLCNKEMEICRRCLDPIKRKGVN